MKKAWKIYGSEGHRQRQAFGETVRYDWSDADHLRKVSLIRSDVTGTCDYVIIEIERDTAAECDAELEGQLSDGFFENCRYGKVEEIKMESKLMTESELINALSIRTAGGNTARAKEWLFEQVLVNGETVPEGPVNVPGGEITRFYCEALGVNVYSYDEIERDEEGEIVETRTIGYAVDD